MKRLLNPNRGRDIAAMRRDLEGYRSGNQLFPKVTIAEEGNVHNLPRKAKKVVKLLLIEQKIIEDDRHFFGAQVDMALRLGVNAVILTQIGRNALSLANVLSPEGGEQEIYHDVFPVKEVQNIFGEDGITLPDGRSVTYGPDGLAQMHGEADLLVVRRAGVAGVMFSGTETPQQTSEDNS